ncbi:tyrosine-type recombinase/integrase [Tardiphaga sp. 813_E8_N1_3]|uniref:tyrosine-type recombinase/integrase n=1 Tax=Tardiphaga sp. 813_E8_N1_3 TaxID=3240760 RepID=UPI003F22E5A0
MDKGQIVGQKLPLKPSEVWGIRTRLEVASNLRELTLFNLAIDSKLRACDLTCIRVRDLMISGLLRSRATVIQKKTGRPVHFEVSEQTKSSLEKWIASRKLLSSDFLFPSRKLAKPHLSTRQYGRIVDRWVVSLGLDRRRYGTHSLRRTKVSQIYKKTGNLRAVQLLLGHTKLESTVRYLGIEIGDALAMSEHVDL